MTMAPEVLRAEGRATAGPVDKLRYWVDLTDRSRRAVL